MILVGVIFLAEVTVVTLGTVRIIFVARGHKILAPTLGFFEVSIWLFAITQTMRNLNDGRPWEWSLADWYCFLAFALGFTLGNFFGILIEKKLALGSLKLHIITHARRRGAGAGPPCRQLRGDDHRVQGAGGPVDIILTVIRRKQLPQILAIIENYDPYAFYAANELQTTSAGIFPLRQNRQTAATNYAWHMVSQQEMMEQAGKGVKSRPGLGGD